MRIIECAIYLKAVLTTILSLNWSEPLQNAPKWKICARREMLSFVKVLLFESKGLWRGLYLYIF
uniref:Uncharacterized protein n=1 Tax=Meloidogyne enterolobii TaxID=390850 RepID=A0A6V7VNV7_MELEN|nr:unnamed protein product [Meloidogyne enterolobii]